MRIFRTWILVFCLVATLYHSDGYRWRAKMDVSDLARIHNRYRRLLALSKTGAANMRKVSWDRSLAKEAEKEAHCDNFKTSAKSTKDSLFSVFELVDYYQKYDKTVDVVSLKLSLNSIVRKWYNERQSFIPELNMCIPGKECSHYKQLAAAEVERVGCAVNPYCVTGGSHMLSIVCLYSPGLNARIDPGSPLFSEGSACTRCPESSAFCEGELCVPCQGNPKKCECKKTCRKNKYGVGKLDKASCTCDCMYGTGANCDEPCANPAMYHGGDYNVCDGITADMCDVTNPDYVFVMEYCPTVCSCKPMPP